MASKDSMAVAETTVGEGKHSALPNTATIPPASAASLQTEDRPSTPSAQTATNHSELSPPASIHTAAVPATSANTSTGSPPINGHSESAVLNQNGKRVYNPGSAKIDASAVGRAVGGPFTSTSQTHEASGYTWDKEEDAPGYSWRNKKAQEDYNRSWDQIVDKDKMIRRRYGGIVARANDKNV